MRLLLLDDSLFPQEPPLLESQFSSPLLGRVYSLLWQAKQEGRPVALGTVFESLNPEEASHITPSASSRSRRRTPGKRWRITYALYRQKRKSAPEAGPSTPSWRQQKNTNREESGMAKKETFTSEELERQADALRPPPGRQIKTAELQRVQRRRRHDG